MNEVTTKDKEPYFIIENVKSYKPLQVRFKKDCKFKADDKVVIIAYDDFNELLANSSESNAQEVETLTQNLKELKENYDELKENYDKVSNERDKLKPYKTNYEILRNGFNLIIDKLILLNENYLTSAILEAIEQTTQYNIEQFKGLSIWSKLRNKEISKPLIQMDNITKEINENLKNEVMKDVNNLDLIQIDNIKIIEND